MSQYLNEALETYQLTDRAYNRMLQKVDTATKVGEIIKAKQVIMTGTLDSIRFSPFKELPTDEFLRLSTRLFEARETIGFQFDVEGEAYHESVNDKAKGLVYDALSRARKEARNIYRYYKDGDVKGLYDQDLNNYATYVRMQVENIPIGGYACYYCALSDTLYGKFRCETCTYGALKGVCSVDDSLYYDIQRKLVKLVDSILDIENRIPPLSKVIK